MANGATGPTNGATGPTNSIGDIRNLIAFLVAGFAGVLNLLGLKSTEIGVVLRNDIFAVTVAAVLLLLGIVTATVSVFVKRNFTQCVLLIVSILLTSTAAYGALRLESRSQTDAVAEMGDDLQVSGRYDILSLSISASKLSAADWLGVSVFGVPRGRQWNINVLCSLPASVKEENDSGLGCQGDPCFYFAQEQNRTCSQISGNVIAPNSAGGVQRTLKVLISAKAFKHVQVLARACMPESVPAGKCGPTGSATRLDVSIPEPS
jgi:hypothetical protein